MDDNCTDSNSIISSIYDNDDNDNEILVDEDSVNDEDEIVLHETVIHENISLVPTKKFFVFN